MSQEKTIGATSDIPAELFAAALEESVDAIYLIEPETGLIVFANRAGREDLGYCQEEITSMRVSDVQTRVMTDDQWDKILNVMRTQRSLLFRGEHRRSDGSSFPVEVHSTVADVGSREMMISVVRDMSGWDSQEQALRSSETTLRTVLDTMGEGVLVLDADGNFTIANNAFCDLTGIDRDQIEGRKPIDNWPVIHEDGSEYPGDELPSWYTLKTRQPVRNDVQGVIRPDGEICWLLAHSEPLVTTETGDFEGVLVTLSDITELKEKEAELDRRARYDALTGHPNRFSFVESLTGTLEGLSAEQKLAVLFLDMDNFKAVNDSMGHETGDQLLRAVADRFSEQVPQGAEIARLGGDEFICFLPLASTNEAAARAEEILESLREPFEIAGKPLYVSGSIGIAVHPRDGSDTVTLMKHADIAMYRAKKEGRNRYRYFSHELGASADDMLTLSSELRHAVNEHQFELHYQPVLELAGGRPVALEALLRWRHPQHGVMLPDRFIELLENTGMIVEVGERVINEACAALGRIRMSVDEDLSVAVNISVCQFRQHDFLDMVENALTLHDLPGDALHLELTERVLIDDERSAIDVISSLRAMGVTVSLDDFGTGYSSLSYLQRLPVQNLKIDKSFVPHQPGIGPDDSLSRTIIGLAENLDREVIVEGIETREQFEFMRREGARFGQGFLFSEAVPEAELPALLSRRLLPAA